MAGATESRRSIALLVEDEYLVGLDIADQLAEIGFEVVGPAGRVTDAMRLAEQMDSLALGVLDINLAGEQSWPVARLLKERGVPFIFVTGYLEAHASMPDFLSGAIVCSKPIEAAQLRRAIGRALGPG